ncbi:unnamed protein product [Cuscuta epithymum]|uniref:AAA+ ATPase domain-containing protein n=1 Tax=Cuscuta epithymum TaxID=186058 RepID=A0AAV0CAU8_9ASTE|nr:unnamed protein product [Cuscuta epithymum]
MEQKSLFISALGVGVGVGLGLASGQAVSKWSGAGAAASSAAGGVTADQIELELRRLVLDGKDADVTFDNFPYFLSERSRESLTSAAYFHLNHMDMSRHTRNLPPASRAILLSGLAELCQQSLAKALAHHFKAKLLLLDISNFSQKIQSKYGGGVKTESSSKRSLSEVTLGSVSNWLGSFSILPGKEGSGGILPWQTSGLDVKSRNAEGSENTLKQRRNAPISSAPTRRSNSWAFDEKSLLLSLYKVLVSVSSTECIILYIRDIDRHLQCPRFYRLFERTLNKISGSVLVLGSRMIKLPIEDLGGIDEKVSLLFPYNIEIRPPEDETHLSKWKSQLEEDMKMIQFQDNRNHIAIVLAANDIECDDLGSICQADAMVLSNYIEEIIVSAISYHVMHNKDLEYRNGKLVISSKSLSHGLSIFQEGKKGHRDSLKLETNAEKSDTLVKNAPEVPPDNEFEKRLRPEVIPAKDIGVTFEDIGSLDETKKSLQELVMLPLRRPDLFNGGLLKPCRGILLFGPPGTGKTMLAKAIANEAGASFINVSMSTITSKWFGEDEKTVRALFTLAAKVSPTIIFVDEVDSMLGQRTRLGEHEAMRKIKNEFMTHWDGLLTKAGERILVLAATNRPFDLDEAIIRRFERRIMVGLPSAENREKILRTLLAKEKVEDIDFKELATMTDGYSGSDLKNLCVTAAYRPVRELIQQEREKDMEKKHKAVEGQSTEDVPDKKDADKKDEAEERVITLRPLNMEDMKLAKNQIAASFAVGGSIMAELKQWNELYGEGGSRKKEQLSYFF